MYDYIIFIYITILAFPQNSEVFTWKVKIPSPDSKVETGLKGCASLKYYKSNKVPNAIEIKPEFLWRL